MKRRTKITLASVLAAVIIAASPAATLVPVTLTAEAAEVKIPKNYGVKPVTTTGDLTVTVPNDFSASYEVRAYEMLQLVVPKDSTEPSSMTNDDNSQNVYFVTETFKAFFETAKTTYNKDLVGLEKDLYLTYNTSSNCLEINETEPKGTQDKDYIVIDNKAYEKGNHAGKLDKKYFEADLVSRIVSSPDDPTGTNASAARLLSDWASRYIKAKESINPDETDSSAEEVDGKTVFKLENLVYGYYVVLTVDNNNDNDNDNEGYVINQSILNVPEAKDVTLKATPITIDKSVSNLVDANNKNNGGTTADTLQNNTTTKRDDDDPDNGVNYDRITANIGDVLQYRIESHIPSLTSYDLNYADTADKLLGLEDDDNLTANDFDTDEDGKFTSKKIKDKYVYIFRDTMTNQDFIPAETKVSDVTVEGLKVDITYYEDKIKKEANYVVKNFGTDDAPEYYLVLSNENVKDNAIGRLWETDYTVASKKNFFAINFDLEQLKKLKYDGCDVVFTYNAELKGETGNSDAVNNATLTYSNDPFDSSSFDTITDEDEVYTYDLKVDKLFSDGATIDFYDEVTFKLYSDSEEKHVIYFVEKKDDEGKTIKGSYVRADSDDGQSVKKDTLAINPTDGTLLLHGLGEGTYYLKEQENEKLKNAGYNIVNTITINVTAKSVNTETGVTTIADKDTLDLFYNDNDTYTTATLDGVTLPLNAVSNEYGVEFDVINQKGFKLPLTGEYGNWALAIAGIVIVAVSGTVIVLVNRKKKDLTADNES